MVIVYSRNRRLYCFVLYKASVEVQLQIPLANVFHDRDTAKCVDTKVSVDGFFFIEKCLF